MTSILERLDSPFIAGRVVEWWRRSPALVEEYDFPASFPPNFRRFKAFDERYTYRLRDVLVSPQSGLTWIPGGPILQESHGHPVRTLGWGNVLHEPLLPVAMKFGGPIVSFAPISYFHWLLEIVPSALSALEIEPRAQLLMPPRAPAYVEEAARWLTGGRVFRAPGPVHADDLLLPGIEPWSGFVPSQDIELVRSRWPEQRPGEQSVIYVSRRHDRIRQMGNEGEIEAALRSLGVGIVHAQELPLHDQAAAFAGAEQVIAPHGAGLANIVFSRRLRSVVEIFPAETLNDCYARLSRQLGVDYSYVTCSPDPASSGLIPVSEVIARVIRDT